MRVEILYRYVRVGVLERHEEGGNQYYIQARKHCNQSGQSSGVGVPHTPDSEALPAHEHELVAVFLGKWIPRSLPEVPSPNPDRNSINIQDR